MSTAVHSLAKHQQAQFLVDSIEGDFPLDTAVLDGTITPIQKSLHLGSLDTRAGSRQHWCLIVWLT